MQVIVADFEGLWDDKEKPLKNKKNKSFLVYILALLPFTLLFVSDVKVEQAILLILPILLILAIARNRSKPADGSNQSELQEKKKIIRFHKKDLRDPRMIAMKLLGINYPHKAREPAIHVIVCELTKELAPQLERLATELNSLMRKNVAKTILFTNPSDNAPNCASIFTKFHQVVLYDGDLNSSIWNWKIAALKNVIEKCSAQLQYEEPGLAVIYYNSFLPEDRLDVEKFKYEIMTLGLPLFSNSEPVRKKGKEIVFYATPERLKSEVTKVIQGTFVGENKESVEIFNIYLANEVKEVWKEIANVNESFIEEIEENNEDYVVSIVEPDSDTPFQIDRKMFEGVKELANLPKESRARALFDWLSKVTEYKENGGGYKNSRETFYNKGGVCGELSFLYTVLARSIGLKSGYVSVKVDVYGERVNHGCSWVDVSGREILVDLAYRTYDIKHREYEKIPDDKVVEMFNSWRRQ